MGQRVLGLLIAFLLASALVPTGTAQKDIDVYRWGVLYFVATGTMKSAHFGLDPAYDGKNLIPFDGCGNILARPSKGAGVVEVVGLMDKTNLVEIFFDEFRNPDNKTKAVNGIGANITIDGSEDHEGTPTHPMSFARVAAYAQAHIEVDGYNFTEDPIERKPKTFWASLFVTNTGFRDNESKAILTESGAPYAPGATDAIQGKDDWEMHLRLEAPGPSGTMGLNYRSRGDAPDGSITYQEEHVDRFSFISMSPGGKADITFTSSSRGPEGMTSLRFVIRSPGGVELQNFTLAPSVLSSPQSKTVSFPLNNFGAYTIDVAGKAALAQYSGTGRVTPPAKFDFNFWWENVSFEKPALEEISDCKDRLLNSLTESVMEGVGRDKPPVMNVQALIVGTGVSVLGALLAVKLVADAVITSKFKSGFKRR